MFTISPRLKHLLFVLVAQVGCIAAGLWVQSQLVVSSVQRARQDPAGQSLVHQAKTGTPAESTTIIHAGPQWQVVSDAAAPAEADAFPNNNPAAGGEPAA